MAPKACSSCHDTKSWEAAADKMRDNHPGLSLKNGHRRVKCETCHADAKGGKIAGLDKDKGHKMCHECHKTQAKGPQKCAECHKK